MNIHTPPEVFAPAKPRVRALHPGMGQAVAERTVLRKVDATRDPENALFHTVELAVPEGTTAEAAVLAYAESKKVTVASDNSGPLHSAKFLYSHSEIVDGKALFDIEVLPKRFETWEEVATRVAMGNASLIPAGLAPFIPQGKVHPFIQEFRTLKGHLASGTVLMSGRHLQHGDVNQPERNQEVFTNCATAPFSFGLFKLLLNGSGVGRSYDDDIMLTDWDNAPLLRVVISASHPDFDWASDEDVREAKHKYSGDNVIWHEVADTREGWAKAIELWERLTFERIHRDKTLVLDFSKVRPKGAPIMGMQGRPSSGPKPLMGALLKVASIRGAGMKPWRQALYVDHYLAECVLVGGARRSARMSTKWWGDKDILDFIDVKRPVEYADLSMDEVIALRAQRAADGLPQLNTFLWSSNNSVMVDAEFWDLVSQARAIVRQGKGLSSMSAKIRHAWKVITLLTERAYGDGTGEPGIINADSLTLKRDGWDALIKTGEFAGSAKYQIDEESHVWMVALARAASKKKYPMITNPCGEIALTILGGYCVIADVVPFHSESLEEAEDAIRATTRALMRVNTMDCFYRPEVKRTNRIGVGLTGVHEFAWKFFKATFRSLLQPDFDTAIALDEDLGGILIERVFDNPMHFLPGVRAAAFWLYLSRLSNAVVDEAHSYAEELGVSVPHTMLTIKPAGTTSKLFGLTEGWHLPSMLEYLRWVQFKIDDPLVAAYEAEGYPVRRDLKQYRGMAIVGFPTQPTICSLGIPPHELVTAAEATPEEQFQWLRLGERFWIDGQTNPDDEKSGHGFGNQISYTLKFKPDETSYIEFFDMIVTHMPTVRCCSVMPQIDGVAFEYQPEEPLAKGEYERIAQGINSTLAQDIGREHIDCASGACPVDYNTEK